MKEKISVVIENYGCSANQNDGEIMAGLLERAGCDVIMGDGIKNNADIVIINTCVVKGPTLKRMERRIKELLKRYDKVIVSGCMASGYYEKIINVKNKFKNKSIALVPPDNVMEINKIIKDILNKKNILIKIGTGSKNKKINLPKKRINRVIGITQISSGCSSFCTFCITKLVKGYIKSYEINDIVANVSQDIREGCKEIWLTGTDVGCYGVDKGKYLLPTLIKKISKINGRFWVRIGMMNPEHVKNFIDELLEAYESKKIFKFLHIPLQSGSDRVLKEMRRNYSVKEFLEIVKKFRKNFPNSSIATDIIVGFYNEREVDFKKTIEVIKKIKPEIVNISRFWPMPKTLAFKYLNNSEIKRIEELSKIRSKKLSEIVRKIMLKKNKRYLNKEILCLVDKKGYGNTYLARDINYKLIVIKEKVILGKFYNVKIKESKSNYVVGNVVNKMPN